MSLQKGAFIVCYGFSVVLANCEVWNQVWVNVHKNFISIEASKASIRGLLMSRPLIHRFFPIISTYLQNFGYVLCILSRFFGVLPFLPGTKNRTTQSLTIVLFFPIFSVKIRNSLKIYRRIPEGRILMRNQKGLCPMLYYALYHFAETE